MKAFFSGSIRGGDKYRSSYLQILAFLKHYGDIISEHSDQQANCDDQGLSGDAAIYARDIRWIKDADLLVAEVSHPSIGVGYEVAYAEARDIPVLALYHLGAEAPMSAMISGNPRITVIRYNSLSELWPLLEKKLGENGF
jgi:hypothetical protein